MSTSSLISLVLSQDRVNEPIKSSEIAKFGSSAALICEITVRALQDFQKGNLSQFDALVKEEACHIRACRIALLFQRRDAFSPQIKEAIQTAQEVKPYFLREISPNLRPRTIQALFGQNNFTMSEPLQFVVLSFLLSLTKDCKTNPECFFEYKDETAPQKLRSIRIEGMTRKFSNNQLRNIVDQAQVALAKLSVKYVKQLGSLSTSAWLMGRPCIPCFEVMDLLLKHFLACDQKVLVEITVAPNDKKPIDKKIQLLFAPNLKNTGFQQHDLHSELDDTAVVVFAGYSIDKHNNENSINRLVAQFLGHNLVDILLANAAIHPQFPKRVSVEMLGNPRIEQYKALGHALGCCRANSSLFCIDHIYATTFKEMRQCFVDKTGSN